MSERGLTWAVGIPFKQKVYPADVAMIFPVAGRGRPSECPYMTIALRAGLQQLSKLRRALWR